MSLYTLRNAHYRYFVTHDGKVKCHNKGCDFECYYSSVSLEGFCSDCEFKLFPERYIGCIMCRKLNFKIPICYICKEETRKLLFNIFCKYGKSISTTIELGIEQILTKCESLKLPQLEILTNDRCRLLSIDPWKGFYKGNMKWCIPDVSHWDINIDDITNENCEMVIIRELEKNGIFIYKNVQLVN